MPEYLAPGVYVEEVDTGPKPIEGVSTSTSGMVGVTEWGPVNIPTLVTGFADFQRQFGGYLNRRIYTGNTWYLPHAVEGFFTNGGKRLYIVRVLPETATTAATLLFNRGLATGVNTQLASGALQGHTALVLESSTGIEDEGWLRIDDEAFSEYVQIDMPASPALQNRGIRALRSPLHFNHAAGASTPISVFPMQEPTTDTLSTTLDGAVTAGETRVRLVDRTNVDADKVLQIGATPTREFVVVASVPVDSLDRTVTLRHPLTFDHANSEEVELVEEGTAEATTQLNQSANVGMAVLILDNLGEDEANFNSGDIVRIGTEDNREYHVLAGSLEVGARTPAPLGQRIPIAFRLQRVAYADHPATEPVQVVTLTETEGTHLQSPASVDDTTITLVDRGDLAEDQTIRIGTGANQEFLVITDVPTDPSNTTITLNHPLAFAHPGTGNPDTSDSVIRVGVLQTPANVGDTTITLVDRGGLAEDQIICIGTGANQEFLKIIDIPSDPLDTTITLNHPLAFNHLDQSPNSNPVVRVTRTVEGTPVIGTTVQALSLGQNLLMLTDNETVLPNGTEFASNNTVEIGAENSPQVEYQTLGNLVDLALVGVQGLAGMGTNDGLVHNHSIATGVMEHAPLLRVQAIDAGSWGNCLQIKVEDENPPLLRTTAAANPNPGDTTLTLASTQGIAVGTVLAIEYTPGSPPSFRKVVGVIGRVVTLDSSHTVAVTAGTRVSTSEFRLTVECVQVNPITGKPRLIASEVHRQLSMDPRHSRYVTKVIGAIFRSADTTPRRADGRTEGESNLLRVEDALADDTTGALSPSAELTALTDIRLGPDLIWDQLPGGRQVAVGRWLMNGDDQIAAITDNTYIGQDATDPNDRQGLFALKNINEISIVAIPGRTNQQIQEALINHCELMRYRFAVLDSAVGSNLAEVQEQRGLYDTRYAALYHPWLRINDPFPENPRITSLVSIPPSGHIIGIYARSDIERGVHKAPANEVIRGISDLEFKLMKEEQDILNPQNINVLRNFREDNRGLRVWGARTLSSDPDWKYVNVRRLFIFVEKSIDRGTQWVVFEPNDVPLWQRVKRVITAFLTQVWRDGALMGRTPEEAFFVKCDRTTMTQADIDNGRLIVQIGIAPVKPAEFVIFRIGQWTGGSSLEEG